MKKHIGRLRAAAALLLTVLLMLGGCESMLEREYAVTSQHAEATTTTQSAEVIRVTTIGEVMDILAETVRQGTPELTVQLAYRGENLDFELKEAIAEYQNDPICAYAVQLIPYRTNKLLTYYEIRFDISYRRTAEQIAAIRTVRTPARFEEEMAALLRDFAQTRSYLIYDYDAAGYDPDRIIRAFYESTPEVAYGLTDVTFTLSPETGDRRVMEVTVSYAEDAAVLAEKSRRGAELAEFIASSAHEEGDAQYLWLHDRLCRFAEFNTEAENAPGDVYTDPYTVYGALVQYRAVSTGYAMAYKQLCDAAGLECRVVHGRLGSDDHSWNMVKLADGNWYHVDVSLDDDEEMTGYRFFGLNDIQMGITHQWDAEKYDATRGWHGRDILPEDEELRSHSRLPFASPLPGETKTAEPATEPTAPSGGSTTTSQPSQPTQPEQTAQPTTAAAPVEGGEPSAAEPSEPSEQEPSEPGEATEPTEPTDPTEPTEPQEGETLPSDPGVPPPGALIPDLTLPTLPELTVPEIPPPDQTEPGGSVPEATAPADSEPDVTEPAVTGAG